MDNLVELSLRGSRVKIVPSTIGRYCTNLASLDLRDCYKLKAIEGNFHLLKQLKGLYLNGSYKLEIPVEALFDVEYCLQVLSLSCISFKNPMLSMKLHGFSCFLRRLNLSSCNLVDGDISSVFSEGLSNLQVLDLSCNKFSRLYSSLLQLPRLKYLNLSSCYELVELPDLPSSIAILIAHECDSLEFVGNLPTNCKWLWKFSVSTKTMLSGGERIVQSMLQGNALEDYFMSLQFLGTGISTRDIEMRTFMLELPRNWYNDFCGFLISMKNLSTNILLITIRDVMGMDYEDNVLQAFDKTSGMCYISFGSLRHTTWWNSPHSTISFFVQGLYLKAELVRKRDSKKRAKDRIDGSEFWDEEDRHKKTFEIEHDSKSSIEISWCHRQYGDMCDHI